jgi:hypothetical protein
MSKKFLLLGYGLCVSICVCSQQITQAVIVPAGDVNATSKMYLEWTLGEPAIETLSSKYQVVTQGFHQPLLRAKARLTIAAPQAEQLTITVLPNPVQNRFKTFIERGTNTRLFLDLSDISGRSLYHTLSTSKVEVIDFDLSPYASGTFILTVRDSKGRVFQTHKIIKAQ